MAKAEDCIFLLKDGACDLQTDWKRCHKKPKGAVRTIHRELKVGNFNLNSYTIPFAIWPVELRTGGYGYSRLRSKCTALQLSEGTPEGKINCKSYRKVILT
jgi:hypothetical protein